MSSVPQRTLTVREYLAREELSPTKHEFYRGELFAMAGGSLAHGIIATNIVTLLNQTLSARGCRAYSGDHRIFIPGDELHTYPDASVVCGEPTMSDVDPYAITNPLVLIEVLSPSTEHYDRGKKFDFYRKIESFRDYVLVDQFEPRIECFSRSAAGLWKIDSVEDLESAFSFPSLGCTVMLGHVYRDVRFLPRNRFDAERSSD